MAAAAFTSALVIAPSAIFADVIAPVSTVGFGYVPLRSPPAAPVGVVAGVVHTTPEPLKLSTCPLVAPDPLSLLLVMVLFATLMLVTASLARSLLVILLKRFSLE